MLISPPNTLTVNSKLNIIVSPQSKRPTAVSFPCKSEAGPELLDLKAEELFSKLPDSLPQGSPLFVRSGWETTCIM